MAKLSVITLGCAKNTVFSNKLKYSLQRNNHQLVKNEQADYLIVNTCGFIQAAQEQSIETLIKLYQAKKTGSRIIATGCLVDLHYQELAKALPEVDVFLRTADLAKLEYLLGPGEYSLRQQALKNSSYAYLKIADGCNLKCSFCIIPKIKGKFTSRSCEEIIQEAEQLAASGVKELVIISQDTGRYGLDIYGTYSLMPLLKELSKLNFKWIRIMYLQPRYLTKKLIKFLANEEKICAYLDVPIQHANLRILRDMRRPGNKEQYLKVINNLRKSFRSKFYWRTSVIVGFPGESRAEFQELLNFIKQARPNYVGVFGFSAQEGTRAAALEPKVKTATIKKRVEVVRQVADEIALENLLSWVGQETEVLIDKVKNSQISGRTHFQAPEIDGEVLIANKQSNSRLFSLNSNKGKKTVKVGDVVKVHLKSQAGYDFIGEIKDVYPC